MKKYSKEEIMNSKIIKEINQLEECIFTMKRMREIFGGNIPYCPVDYSDETKPLDEWMEILQTEYEKKGKQALKKFTGTTNHNFNFRW